MPVVNDEGVIGRVLDVSDRHCRVLLITDQGSSVDAVDQRNRVRGILCGKDPNGCLLKYIRSNLDIREGDLVITSGKDGVFPKGLRLGVIQAAYKDPVDLFQKIEVKPLVRLSALEEVLIIKHVGAGLDVEEEQPAEAASTAQTPPASNPAVQAPAEEKPGSKPAAKPQPAKPAAKPAAKPGAKPPVKPPAETSVKPKSVTKPQSGPRTGHLSKPKAQNPAPAKPETKPSGKPQSGSPTEAGPKPPKEEPR
jgi:hypothetical protein